VQRWARVPTFTELGYPQLEAIAWMGLWVTPDVPAAAQTRLREAALKVMAQPQVAEKLRKTGSSPASRAVPTTWRALRADYERVGAILKSIGFAGVSSAAADCSCRASGDPSAINGQFLVVLQ
jgi:tripartite-type tricarboxylate transporter receptor subunit TctC